MVTRDYEERRRIITHVQSFCMWLKKESWERCLFGGMGIEAEDFGMESRLLDVMGRRQLNVGNSTCLSIGRPSGRSKSNQPGCGSHTKRESIEVHASAHCEMDTTNTHPSTTCLACTYKDASGLGFYTLPNSERPENQSSPIFIFS